MIKGKILRAFAELLIKQGYESLSIQDILVHAQVGRTSFYEHFRSKEDLLVSSVNTMGASVLARRQSSTPLSFTLPLFEHVGSPDGVYDSIIGRPDFAVVEHHVKRMLLGFIIQDLRAEFVRAPLPLIEACGHQLLGALWSLMRWWKENRGLYSSAEINDLFHRLSMPGIQDLLGKTSR